MIKVSRTRAALAILALALLAGCTSTVAGNGASTPSSTADASPTVSRTHSTSRSPAPNPGAALTDPSKVHALLAETGRDIVTANSYDYRRLAAFRRSALAVTTGPLTTRMGRTIDFIAENAPALRFTQTTRVLHLGIAAFDGTEAKVLAFGRLAVRNTRAPKGRSDPFAALAGVRFVHGHWLLDLLEVNGRANCNPPGTPDLVAACRAAAAGIAAITTFRRAHFEQDFAHALTLLAAALRADVVAKKRETRRAMIEGGFDLRGDVVASAVESVTSSQVVVLVSLNGYRSDRSTPLRQQFVVTVNAVNGRWLLSEVANVGES